jgi:hypothetical protein
VLRAKQSSAGFLTVLESTPGDGEDAEEQRDRDRAKHCDFTNQNWLVSEGSIFSLRFVICSLRFNSIFNRIKSSESVTDGSRLFPYVDTYLSRCEVDGVGAYEAVVRPSAKAS